jgi:hypothetical protein
MEINLPQPPAAPITRAEALNLVDAIRDQIEVHCLDGAAGLRHVPNIEHQQLGRITGLLWDEYPLDDITAAARHLNSTFPAADRAVKFYVQAVCAAIAE